MLKFQTDVLKKKDLQVQKLPEVDLGGGGLDPKTWAEKVVSSAKSKQAQSGPGLQLAAPVAAIGLLKDALLSPAEKLIREAKVLIKDKKFKDARAVLARAKKTDPDLLMAPILDSLCCYRLGDDWAALECLRDVHGKPMDEGTGKYYVQAMELVRKRMLPAVVDECVAQINAKNYQPAINTLSRAVSLDPTVPVYHSLFADALFLGGHLQEALAAADNGLALCPQSESEDLRNLRNHIVDQLAFTSMQPAVALYRANDYSKARTHLASLSPVVKELPLWKTFDGYLYSLTGWFFNKKIAKVAPTGTPAEIEALYNLLVGNEITYARLMLLARQYELANEALEQANALAPRCAYLQFLRGVCIYQHMGYELAIGNRPPMETVCYRLQDARALAVLAVELGYAPARDFIGVLQEILRPMEEVVAPPEEATLINGVVDQFVQAMKLAPNGITSLTHLDQVYYAIQAAGKAGEKLRGRVQSKSAIGTLNELAQVVKSHCAQLDALRNDFKEGDIADKHFKAFKTKMDAIQARPIASLSELNTVKSYFQTLKYAVENDRRTMRSEQVKKDLDQLLQVIGQVLQQLEPRY